MKSRPPNPKLLDRLTTLGDIVRLRILRLLDQHELSVGELARALQAPQSTVSRHLKLLHEGGWVIKRSHRTASLYCMVEDALSDENRALWQTARAQLGDAPVFEEDDARIAEVLAERRADSESFFGRLGGEWDSHRRSLFGEQFTTEALLALVDPSWTIADLGCGTGDASEWLAPYVQRVIAVDREPAMLDAARKRLAGQANVEFRRGDLTALPIDDSELDAALVFLVLHHLREPAAAIRDIARTLRSGGVLLVVDMVPHDRESYRHTMGHKHLGFDAAEVSQWADAAQLRHVRYRRLHPSMSAAGPGLFVATMQR
jgi:ArsR family transcriptional regulator